MITLRQASATDLKEMQRLFVDTISTVCTKDYDKNQIKVWTSSVENTQRWLDMLNEQFVLIAERNCKIVGFGSLEYNNYIDFLYVHKDFQKQGIAYRLFSELEIAAKKCGAAVLTSHVSKTAKPFFEMVGFKVVSENKNILKGIEIVNYLMEKK